MLRIAMISPLPPQQTGESAYTKSLIQSLVDTADVKVFAICGSDADVLQVGENVETLRIWDGRKMTYPLTLARKIVELRPHIVHVQFGPDGRVYGGRFGEPMLALLLILRAMGIKTTVTSHSTWITEQVRERIESYGVPRAISFLAKPFFRLYMKLLDWGTDTIQLSTSATNSTLRRVFLRDYKINSQKVFEIPHPCRYDEITVNKNEAKSRLGLSERDVILVFGFIRRGKGIETAIQAMKWVKDRFQDCLLVIAGRPVDSDGQRYLQELRSLTESMNLGEYVKFVSSYIPEGDVRDYFIASSTVVLPYSESVGASGPAHNYAYFGTPIIASDVGYHMKEALGGKIFLFRPGDAKDLARRIEWILSNPEEAKRTGRMISEYARRENWSLASVRTRQNYRKTLDTD